MIKYPFAFIVTIFTISIQVSSNDCNINIFDVGQGNCVLLEYKNQAIMVDAGSLELNSSAYYHNKYSFEAEKYFLSSEGAINLEQTETSDSSSASAIAPTSVERSSYTRDSYKKFIINSIKHQLYNNNMSHLNLKTLIISHSDIDHNNWLPRIFTNNFTIENAIFGGFYRDYTKSVQKWIHYHSESSKNIINLFFTGMRGGSLEKKGGEWSEGKGYARPYCSALNSKTSTEQAIEASLKFSSSSTQKPPSIKILSMNAGHAWDNDGNVYIKDPDPNANSIVLRISHNGGSFLIPGDANQRTWEHILQNYKSDELTTSCLLLSHHGASEKGCNSKDILDKFQPRYCFISAGRRNGFRHPRGEVIDLLIKSDSIEVSQEKKVISYFREEIVLVKRKAEFAEVYKRKKTTKAIYSTQDYGTLHFTLSHNIQVNFHRNRASKDTYFRFEKIGKPTRLSKGTNKIAKELADKYNTFVFYLETDDGSPDKQLKPAFKSELENREFYILGDLINREVCKIQPIIYN